MKNGMLIWMNQGPTLQGDFLSLAIIEGKPELSFNLGKKTQPVRISSEVNTYFKAVKVQKKLMAYYYNYRSELMMVNGIVCGYFESVELVYYR